ncbi:LysR family transcriptional regulator [Clostridium ihumii]|uniref:LysR family transcriptional regulator n=1 Tax=Clostridium ihumii TaxID=1470356 RepID=UPI003D346666
MISYDYYKVFYYVCKYKNFTKAANVLLTSQSSVSHTIHNLEHQLGCRLFTRNNRGIELTPEGEQLYEYVAIGCEQFLKGESELVNSISLDGGIVYLGTTETALHCFLFDELDKFHLKYPNVKFKINNFSTDEAIDSLKNGVVDMAVTATPFNICPNMNYTNLKTIQDILIAGNTFCHLKDKCISLKELIDYPIISFSNGTKSRDFMEDVFRSNKLLLSPSIESATSDLILPMVKHNLGLGFIPEDMAFESIKKGEVFQINLKESLPNRYISLIYDTQHPHSLASKEFQKFLLRHSNV